MGANAWYMKTTLAALALALSLPLLANADPASTSKKSKASFTDLVNSHVDRQAAHTSTATTTSVNTSSAVAPSTIPYMLPHSGISAPYHMVTGATR